jgi:NNP family nitrate/nitrite transporter-like MFS transporter
MTTTLDRPVAAPPVGRSHWIADWRPEDRAFWEATGARVARRNLVFSILSEHIGFCIWSMWSVFVLFLGKGYGLQPSEKFLLTTVPTAVGSVLRVPYTFAVARFGGRNWTVVSAALLLIPSVLAAIILKPGVSFSTLLIVAAVAGLGGGNFSSSMSNIDAFYPQRLKGWALGLNAGGGNVGVAVVQLVGLAVLATAGAAHPRLILAVYIPLIVVATVCAALFMDNLAHVTNDSGAMRHVVKDGHSLVISVLYIGTFGSFIGFGFAFGQVLQLQFAGTFHTPMRVAGMTFLGPLLGSLFRPVGGRLADRFSGARVSACVFTTMALSAALILIASIHKSLPLFIVGFITLFVLSGLGNGSVYKMIPAIFRAKAMIAVAAGTEQSAANDVARRSSRALIGIAGAVGAMGGVGVNIALRQSFLNTGTGNTAYAVFIGFFVLCVALTAIVYLRPSPQRLVGV